MSTASGLIAWRDSDRRFLFALPALVFILAAIVTLLYGVFSVTVVDGDSMNPTLSHGERILVTRGYSAPVRGDVISFRATEESGRTVRVLKRVVAVQGDTVEVRGDVAYVNGSLSEVAPRARIGDRPMRFGPLIVPEGHVFVLGDNRPISLDSRFIGPVPMDSVIGRAAFVILPVTRIRDVDG